MTGLNLNATGFYKPVQFGNQKTLSTEDQIQNAINQYVEDPYITGGDQMLLNSLAGIASQNGYGNIGVGNTQATTSTNGDSMKENVASMLEAGNKQEVKDQYGAKAVPALLAIVKDTSQPEQVRIDAIATLAKLVDEGKAPASCLVQLLKDPNCKDMAERALANVGKEALPVVKQLLNSGDPQMKESAKNILNDMKDAWAGYENDPKWGQECQELLPEVDKLLEGVNKKETATNNSQQSTYDADDPNNPQNLAGFNRQYVSFSPFQA